MIAADNARVSSAIELVAKIKEDNDKSIERYNEEQDSIALLLKDIPALENTIVRLQEELKDKREALQAAEMMSSKLVERIEVNNETTPGLFIR